MKLEEIKERHKLSYMRPNFGQIGLFTSELLVYSIFSIFSLKIAMEKNPEIKTKDEYKEIFQEMIQHPMHFHKP